VATTAQVPAPGAAQPINLPFIIGASSVGTLIEWYDFYLYGVLAVFFARHFSPSGDDNLALLASLAVFWFGFLLRPFGAIFFGHLGDLIGRKFTSMRTLLLMGAATFVAWLQPDRRPGADLAGGDARAAGPGARGLIWRGRHLRRGARAQRQAGPFYELGSNLRLSVWHRIRVARLYLLRDAGTALPRGDEALKIRF
jgi:hypothetical protein